MIGFVAVFLYAPILFSVGLSLTNWNFISTDADFVGVENYRRVLTDPNFQDAAGNTLLYCVVLIPAQIVIPLLLATLILRVRSGVFAGFYKAALFLPTILAYSTAGWPGCGCSTRSTASSTLCCWAWGWSKAAGTPIPTWRSGAWPS